MGKILESFTKAEIDELRDDFVGNEADTDEYRECQPAKTFYYLNALDEYYTNGPRHIEIMRALHKWANAYITDFEGDPSHKGYAGADAWGDIGRIIFDTYVEDLDEHPYEGNDLDAIRARLER